MVNYKFIGWCQEDNHDKVWAAILLSESDDLKRSGWGQCKWVTIWGRRGKKLQSKIFDSNSVELNKLISSKHSKGYRQVSQGELNAVYPEFQQDLEKTAVWALLAN